MRRLGSSSFFCFCFCFHVVAGPALLDCAARSPADEDACTSDAHCGGGLVCCHSSEDGVATASSKPLDRGFCVKSAVCANVAGPAPAPLPPE